MTARAAAAALLLATLAAGAAEAGPLDGIWGVAKGDGADCKGYVMVLRDGVYSKAVLDLGTTQGLRDTVVGTSTYTLSGGRLEIAPTLSLARPEPRQVFQWDPVGRLLRRDEPTPNLMFRPCPDRPLNPMTR